MTASLTNCTLGVKFKDFVLIAACKTRVNNVVVYQDEVPARAVDGRLALAAQGAPEDAARLLDLVARNATLYHMRHRFPMSARVAAHFMRRTCADALRTTTAFMVSAVLAGFEPEMGPLLYYMDELSSMHEVPSVVAGLGGTLVWALLDTHSGTAKSEEEGYRILKECVKQMTERYFINLSTFAVLVVDKDGVRHLPDICVKIRSFGQGDINSAQGT